MDNVKPKRKKLRIKGLLIVLLLIYLLFCLGYGLLKLPIKSIEITGNSYLKDNYLIEYIDISNESIIKLRKKKVQNKLEELDLVKSAKVKKIYPFKIKIEIEEETVLFYNKNTKKIVLASGMEIPYNNTYLGIPTLINYTPDDIYQEFIKYFKRVDKEVISLISEIEYSQSIINNKVVDDKRFLLRMNDGNMVFINTINIEKFNNYLSIYEGLVNKNGEQKGCLYLDSNSDNINFDDCQELQKTGEDNE